MSIWEENYQLFFKLRDYVITYCTFVENGGHAGTFEESLINKTIACVAKIRANRDYIDKYSDREIRTDEQECEIAKQILDGTYHEPNERMHSLIMRML